MCVILNAVEAVVNVTGGAPQMPDTLRPFPGLIVAPFTRLKKHWATSCKQSIAHGRVSASAFSPSGCTSRIEIVDAPLGIG